MRVHPPVSDWSPAGDMLVSLGIGLAMLVGAGFVFARQDHAG